MQLNATQLNRNAWNSIAKFMCVFIYGLFTFHIIQDAKNSCIEAFSRLKLGEWKFAQKPVEIDDFFP